MRKRQAFTLMELLVVISIITLLLGLLLPAVSGVRKAATRARLMVDMTQFSLGAGTFNGQFGEYPLLHGGGPNGTFRLCTSYPDPTWPEAVFIKQLFNRADLNDTGLRRGGYGGPPIPSTAPDVLDGNQALVFWLTGGQHQNHAGFSLDPVHPFAPPKPTSAGQQADNRKGPFLNISIASLTDANGVYDGRKRDPMGNPYAVFGFIKTLGNYPNATYNGASPYRRSGRPMNAGSVQVISAGPDGVFGPGGDWTPNMGAWSYKQPGYDDLANFRSNNLGAPDGD